MPKTPRFVRPFWATIWTAAREIAIGPITKDGGMRIRIDLREKGKVSEFPLYIQTCVVDGKSQIWSIVSDRNGGPLKETLLYEVET